MKKLISLLLAVCVAASLAACSSGDAGGNSPWKLPEPPDSTPPGAEDAPDTNKTEDPDRVPSTDTQDPGTDTQDPGTDTQDPDMDTHDPAAAGDPVEDAPVEDDPLRCRFPASWPFWAAGISRRKTRSPAS